MKTLLTFAVITFAYCLNSGNTAPVDLSAPTNSLGAADLNGYVRLWREIDIIDFGKGLELPLRIAFSSEREAGLESPYLGVGWWCPLVSASAYLKREKMMRAELLCGKTMYLRRDKADPTKFQSLDQKWTGLISGDLITISRADGWELRYVKGSIQQLRTDTGRILKWIRNGNVVTEIREEGAASSPFKLTFAANGKPGGFLVNGKPHSFELEKRPIVKNVNGQILVSGLEPSLTAWNWPDKSQETYRFEVSRDIVPDLKMTTRENTHSQYKWDPKTRHIVSDGEWNYVVTAATGEFDLPKLERTNAKGQKEFLLVNVIKGITEKQTVQGGHIIAETFTSAGPLYGKVEKIKKVENGKTSILVKKSYDESGNLIRRLDEKGFMTTYTYGKDGEVLQQVVSPLQDEQILKGLRGKEAILRSQVKAASTASSKGDALQALGFFLIHDVGRPDKALALLPDMNDRLQIFNIKMHAAIYDFSLTASDKLERLSVLLSEYPEKESLLRAIIAANEGKLTAVESPL